MMAGISVRKATEADLPALLALYGQPDFNNGRLAHWGMASALVENVVVANGHQGEGIGRAMIQQAFRLAEAKGAYKVALSSNIRSTRAHAFYESLGFEKYGFSFRLEPVPAEPALQPELIDGRAS